MKTERRIRNIWVISGLLLFLLCLYLVQRSPMIGGAKADGISVSYIDANGAQQTATNVTEITAESTAWTGWYAVTGEVTIENRITVNGTAHLILCDGAKLTVSNGVSVNSGNSLTIYGQSSGNGQLIANGVIYCAAIGGDRWQSAGIIVINGGKVTAQGGGLAAGIGGGANGNGGQILINDGTLDATGGGRGAGIGGGLNRDGGSITIHNGTVLAKGRDDSGIGSAGIGGGSNGDSGNIIITGGAVEATGSTNAAGIGGGHSGAGISITITGGNVTAAGSTKSAGIGGGYGEPGGRISISGGVIHASADERGTGIGGSGGNEITISGGVITSIGGAGGAGLGGTSGEDGGEIWITGGSVTATGTGRGAGIGGGHSGAGANVTISGGVVTAKAGDIGSAEAIGQGDWFESLSSGTLHLTDMKGFSSESGIAGCIASSELMASCRGKYIRLEPCTMHNYDNVECQYCRKLNPDMKYLGSNGTDSIPAGSQWIWSESTSWTGWMIVTGTVTIPSRVEVSGTVNLVLCDGKTLTVPKGIHVPSGGKLIIWPQSSGTGKLIVSSPDENLTGIGGLNSEIEIWGGNITTVGGKEAAGLGGGAGGKVIIHRGTVKANGGKFGAGIGGNRQVSVGTIRIENGTVEATGGQYAAGIGGAYRSTGGAIYIEGGTIHANGGQNAAGIGGGDKSSSGEITIEGGSIEAAGGQNGAGIGGGNEGTCETVRINGGTVMAVGGQYAAGIGGGKKGSGGVVAIKGGSATAVSEKYEAIGHGYGNKDSGLLYLDMMKVTAGQSQAEATQITGEGWLAACRNHYVKLGQCEEHQYEGSLCIYCGNFTNPVPVSYCTPDGKSLDCIKWIQFSGNTTILTDSFTGWYVATESFINKKERIEVQGSVNLILCDGVEITLQKGIHVPEGSSLTIWQQQAGTGALSTKTSINYEAAIGGNKGESNGKITINGGIITAKASSGNPSTGAGIGGAAGSSAGEITINAGHVKATGSKNGAAIGGGNKGTGGTIVINGGQLDVQSQKGAGIGGGWCGNGGTITINGGIVNAVSTETGAGIGGGGNGGAGGIITIRGGTVNAKGNEGAGIGGGSSKSSTSDAGIISILGGQIQASSSSGYSIGSAKGGNLGGLVILGWSDEENYISARRIIASQYQFENEFRYRTPAGEDLGAVTAENLAAKDDDTILVPAVRSETTIMIEGGDQSLRIGETCMLTAVAEEPGEGGVWTWTSEQDDIATVDENGTITAVGEGSTTITAVYRSDITQGEASILLTVIDYHTVTADVENGSVTVEPQSALPGDQVTLTFTPQTEYTHLGTPLVRCGEEEVEIIPSPENLYIFCFTMPAGDVTVSAVFSQGEVYLVAFVNPDGTMLYYEYVLEGNVPEYAGEPPAMEPTAQYSFTFARWDRSFAQITENTVYTATYDTILRSYPVCFMNWDGVTVLQDEEVLPYGTTPVFTGEEPVRPADDQYIYVFRGWEPQIESVTGPVTYIAHYDAIPYLKEGENRLSLRADQAIRYYFVPRADSHYRFEIPVGAVSCRVMVFDEDDRMIGYESSYFTDSKIDFASSMEQGKTYTVEIECFEQDAELSVKISTADVYGIHLINEDSHGFISILSGNNAYVGQLVNVQGFIYLTDESEEEYELMEIIVTDADGHEFTTESLDMFYMPACEVWVRPVFRPLIPITILADEHIDEVFGQTGHSAWGKDTASALKDDEVDFRPMCWEEGYAIGSVTVTAEDGTVIPCYSYQEEWDDGETGPEHYVFTMPEIPVTVRIRLAGSEAPAFGTANFALPAGTLEIGERAFEGDASITAAEIPENCENIGNFAFCNCSGLMKIRIPEFCEIGTGVFDGCGQVYVYGEADSPADIYCRLHENCIFVEE